MTAKSFLKKKPEASSEASKFLKSAKGSGVSDYEYFKRFIKELKLVMNCCRSESNVMSPSKQDESSSSGDDEDDEDWGSDTVDSGSESSDEGEGKSASLAMVFLKK